MSHEYIEPLGLTGKSMRHALEVMYAEGFRCEATELKEIMPSMPVLPFLGCVKDHSAVTASCDALTVSILPENKAGSDSPAQLLGTLDTTLVKGVHVFCDWPLTIPQTLHKRYLANRDAAEAELDRRVGNLDILGKTAAEVLNSLMLDGYACGIESANGAAVLLCTWNPKGISYCPQAKLVIDSDWPDSQGTVAELTRHASEARVREAKGNCVIPAPEPDP